MASFVIFPMLATLCGCLENTPFSSSTSSNISGNISGKKPGSSFFKFDYKTVTRISIARNDPTTGEPFSAQVERSKSGADTYSWQIVSQELTDRLAYSNFVEHLLDTLSTLQIQDEAPNGPLESYGLTPPHFAIRFSTESPEKVGSQTEFEIHLGSGDETLFAYDPREPKAIFRVHGALIGMLNHLRNFETLRRKTLLTFESDDIDEIEFWKGSKKTLHIERHGETWKSMASAGSEKTSPVFKKDIQAYLERITHLQIQKFPDDPTWEKAAMETLKNSPQFRIVFKDRKNMPTELRASFQPHSKILTASLSSRAGSVFVIPQEVTKDLNGP